MLPPVKSLLFLAARYGSVCLMGFLGVNGLAGPPVTWARNQNVQEQWGLAEHLLHSGEYYRAITEYKRFLYYFPEEDRAPLAALRIAEAFVRGQWWEEGLEAVQQVPSEDLHGEQKAWLQLLRGICEAQLGRLEEAQRSFRAVLDLSQDPQIRERAQYLLGETLAIADKWEDAAQALERVSPQSGLFGKASHRAKLIRSQTPFPEKSPWLAGLLAALLPGAGHLYTGRWRDAGLTFSVNAAFIAATTEAIYKDDKALAGGLAMLELLWYSGNIFSAVGGAHKYNRRVRRELLEEIHLPSGGLGAPQSLEGEGWRRVQ